jgi:hypothetical protein
VGMVVALLSRKIPVVEVTEEQEILVALVVV